MQLFSENSINNNFDSINNNNNINEDDSNNITNNAYSNNTSRNNSNNLINISTIERQYLLNASNSYINQTIDQPSLFRQNNSLFSDNIQITSNTSSSLPNSGNNYKFSFRKLWKFIGPGFLMSVAYLDPGNLESDLQTGAIVGYKLLWVLLLSTIIGFLLQSLSVRLGATTGFHLAEICRKEYHPIARYFLWIMIEIAIISSDIQQVIGSAVAINLLSNGYVPIWGAILITAADTFVFLLLENTGLRVLEAIFGVFISIMCGSFMYMYIRVAPDQLDVIKGFIPWCSNCSFIEMKHLVGIVGSIVMPHNIYFHSTLVLSRNFDRRNENAINEANKYYAIDSGVALFLSFLGNLFVVSAFSKLFYGKPNANNANLMNAGPYLYQQYGVVMKIIWAIGLLSAGQASTITGTYAGQFVMEGFTKISIKKWIRILIIRTITILCSIIIALAAYESIDQLNFWCNVIQSIQLPFALLPILHFTASKRVMGPFKVHFIVQIFCYLIAAFIIGINFYVIINLIIHTKKLVFYILCGFFVAFYALVILYYSIGVNNAYRIGLLIRRICCTPYAHELDELLHASPVYKHPQKKRNMVNAKKSNRINVNQREQHQHRGSFSSEQALNNQNNSINTLYNENNIITTTSIASNNVNNDDMDENVDVNEISHVQTSNQIQYAQFNSSNNVNSTQVIL